MTTKHVLLALLILGLCGVAFSGYLSYRELFGAPTATACAPVGEPGTVLGYPPCIYGLVMYLGIAVLAALGLRRGLASWRDLRARRASPCGTADATGLPIGAAGCSAVASIPGLTAARSLL